MSSLRRSGIRKRISDDESSISDRENEVPPVKRFRRNNGNKKCKKGLTGKVFDAVTWLTELPFRGLSSSFRESILARAMQKSVDEIVLEDDDEQGIIIDITDKEEDIDVIDIADEDERVEEKDLCLSGNRSKNNPLNNSLHMTPNPLTSSTPFYKNHKASHEKTLKSLSRKPVNGFYNKDDKTKDEKLYSHHQKFHYNQRTAPISNPAADVEILLDTRETQGEKSDGLEIVTEVANRKPYTVQRLREPSVAHEFGATSKDFNLQDSDKSTSLMGRQSPLSKNYTAYELVRLQEKAQYQLLLDKIVNGNTYRPVLSSKVIKKPAQIQVDLTQEENEEPVTDPRCKREVLEQPVNEFLQKYYKPYQEKTATIPKPLIDHKDLFTHEKDEVQVMNVEMPSYKPIPRSKPDFFSPEWIKELKSAINEETEQRLQMVTAQEQKLERYRLRREGKLTSRCIPVTKTLPAEEEFPEITPEMEAVIMDAFDVVNKNATEDFVQLDDCTCSRNDLLTLSGLNWLNDCVINFYFTLIKHRNKESDGKLPAVYVFSSYFFPALKTRGEKHVMRWTRKVDIFSYDLLFIPLHFGMHWALCVVDNRIKAIRYYDSMHGTDADCLRTILNFLIAEMKGKKNQILNPDSYTLEIVKDIPQQMNGSDCGMFSLKYAEYLSRDAPITFTQEHMQYFRRRMVVEIVEKKLFNQVV
ncbi:hypothetical protein TNIN_170372 [Trichonephila inaurata madagascariensis]|uniref:Ubiquitin-like protease family profile domain-containing protein n=1 Tax=Trichonephila inaurata madagascariensis TaxID=2747483 RepID=A0A8X6XI19_9ARAC|nr:hypothetical protein TNIN_170372 [Trichonephila inaurata madagascariensis]